MAVSGGIKFFEKSSSLEVLGAVALASSGDSSSANVLNHNPSSVWRSVSSTDSIVESLFVAIPSAAITRLIFRDINWKAFDVKYWNGSAWTDFTSAISETVFAKTTAYYEVTSVAALTLIRVQITSTQTANAQKRCGQVILTTELGTLAGFPMVGDLSFDRSDRRLKMLTKSTVQKASECFEMSLNFQNYPPTYGTDFDLMLSLFDRDNDFIIWPCGGRSTTTYFRYAIRGFGLNDMYQVRAVGRHQPSYYKNVYLNPVSFKIAFVETANPEEGIVSTTLTFNLLDLYASDADEVVLRTRAFTTTGVTRHRFENSDNTKSFEMLADFSTTVPVLGINGGDIRVRDSLLTVVSGVTKERFGIRSDRATSTTETYAGLGVWLEVTGAAASGTAVSAGQRITMRRSITADTTDTTLFSAAYVEPRIDATGFTYTNTNSEAGVSGLFIGTPTIAGTLAVSHFAFQYIQGGSFNTGVNKYGLRIGDLSGATNNYAIYTGAGTVRFGGIVDCVSSLKIKVYTTNTSNPPTEAEVDSGIGTNATMGTGFMAFIDDNGANTAGYLLINQGTNWWQIAATKCA